MHCAWAWRPRGVVLLGWHAISMFWIDWHGGMGPLVTGGEQTLARYASSSVVLLLWRAERTVEDVPPVARARKGRRVWMCMMKERVARRDL